MVHSVLAYDAGELDAYRGDCPVIVGHNVLRDAIDARWTTTGTQGGADVTAAGSAARRAYDGRATLTTNFSGTQTTVYFNAQIPASTIDTICIIFGANFPSGTVTVQIADDANFTANVVTFAGPFLMQTGCRIVRSFLEDRRQGVEYVRARFVRDGGTYINQPLVAEIFLGRGRVLSQWWGFGNDAEPSRSKSIDRDTPQGDRTRYLHHYDRHQARHQQTLSTSVNVVLDDVATMRSLRDESRTFTRPVLYIPRPASDLSRAMLGFPPKDGLDMPQTHFGTYDCSFDFDEQPPFYDLETCAAPDVVVESLSRVLSFLGPYGAPTGAGFNAAGWGALANTIVTGTENTPALATTSQAAGVPRMDAASGGAVSGYLASGTGDSIGLVGSGIAPGVGGFDLVVRFNLVSDPGSWRALVGVKETVALFDINAQEPTALTGLEFVAFGFPSTDAVSSDWHLYHSSGGGSVTDVDTNIPRNTTSVFQIRIRSIRGDASVLAEIVDLDTGGTYSTTLSTNIPTATSPLYFTSSARHTGATSVGLSLVGAWTF